MENKGKSPQEKKNHEERRKCVFPNRNENTGRHEPTVSHLPGFS